MTLTPEQSETYKNIVKVGNMDTMFEWAYQLGRNDVLKENNT